MHDNTVTPPPLHTWMAIYTSDDGLTERTVPMREGATPPRVIEGATGWLTLRAVIRPAEGESVDDAILREVRESGGESDALVEDAV